MKVRDLCNLLEEFDQELDVVFLYDDYLLHDNATVVEVGVDALKPWEFSNKTWVDHPDVIKKLLISSHS